VGYGLGIDIGTVVVAAAITVDDGVEMFPLGDRSILQPAVVYLREDGTLVAGDAARREARSSPDRAATEFKWRLGDPTPVMLAGTPYAVTPLLAALLRDVIAKVTETQGGPADHIVLTHPASWGPFRRGLFEEVPSLAGLGDVTLVTEPEAAAAHYAASRQLDDGEIVAVYHLGGGTWEATVLRNRSDGLEILAADFEDLVRAPLVTIDALSRALRSARVTPGQLSAVLVVGGSSRITLVARMVSNELGRPVVVDTHPKHTVALGAAELARGGGRPV
jgi:molecular chaperone DnaK (HSP70)